MSKTALIALLVFACLVELGVIVHRVTGRMTDEPPAEPPPIPVVVTRQPSRQPEQIPDLPPLPPDNFPSAVAGNEAAPAAPRLPGLPGLNLPPELMPATAFVAQLTEARQAGADLWLLAHVSDTQFQRQLAAWRRAAANTQTTQLDPNQMRRQFIEATAGNDAWRRLQVAGWARSRPELRSANVSIAQAEALFELENVREAQMREIQRAYSSREIDVTTYSQRQGEMRRQYELGRQKIMGENKVTGAPVSIVR